MKNIYISAFALSSFIANVYAQEDRPNILWLTYEDTSPEFIGCYGNKQSKTPTIDKLAAEGIHFSSAYSTGAVSSASRFCLITGVPANNMGTGNHRSSYKIPEYIKGFPYYLKQAGYYTTNNSKTDYNMSNAKDITQEAWHDSSNKAGWWNREKGQPFFAVYNSNASHQSRTMTNTWVKYEEQVLAQLSEEEQVNDSNLEIPAFFRNSPEMQRHMSRVYNSIALMDKEFGGWLDRLEKDGLKDSTIVFCFSDHGEGITRSKGSATTTGYQVPFVVWIPPIYKHLSPWGDGVITDELVSFEDLAPTMLHLAGLQVPSYMKGRIFMGSNILPKKKYVFSGVDRTDESSELSRTVTDGRYQYTRVFMPFQAFVRWNMYYDVSEMQQTIRNDYNKGVLNEVQRSILEPRQAEYLYDTHSDNWGVQNLIDAPEMKDIVNELRSALKNNILQSRDPHFMTEYVFKESGGFPFELAADKEAYPLERILEAAFLSGKGKAFLTDQIRLLNDPNGYVRYWAAVGLFSQTEGLNEYLPSIEEISNKEIFTPTKNVLTALLYKQDSQKYKDKARMLIKEENPELLRMILNLLISMDDFRLKVLLEDIKNQLEINKLSARKGMYACNEYMRMILHRLECLPISSDDSF